MLILTRKPGESLYIGDTVKVTIVEIKGNQIRVGIDAPSELRIYREEIYLQILEENKKAAETVPTGGELDQLSGVWRSTPRVAQPSVRMPKSSPSPVAEVIVKRKKKKRDSDEGDESDDKEVDE